MYAALLQALDGLFPPDHILVSLTIHSRLSLQDCPLIDLEPPELLELPRGSDRYQQHESHEWHSAV